MAEVHKVMIQVNGMRYPITTSEPEDYVLELSKEIDRTVRMIIDQSKVSANEALVLCCLQCLDAFCKAEDSADHLRSQIAEYLEEASKARAEANEARRELAEMELRLQREGKKN